MSPSSSTVRRSVTVGLAGTALMLFAATAAFAVDNGDWQGGYSTWYPQNCLDRSAGVVYESSYLGPSHCLNSKYRDSDFRNERYGGLNNHPLNDHVMDFRNNFVVGVNIRAYHHPNYGTGSTCITPGTVIGPYPVGPDSGLSSFKSC